MSIVLCWEDLIEPQVQGDFKKHGKGFQCSEKQLSSLRFGAKGKLIHWQCSNTNIYNYGNLCNIYRTCNLASLDIVKNAAPSQNRWELAVF